VIAETLDRGVEEFDGEDEKQARDKRDPGPQVPRDNKRQRQREAGDGELLLDGGLGAETLPDAADVFQNAAAMRAMPPRPGRANWALGWLALRFEVCCRVPFTSIASVSRPIARGRHSSGAKGRGCCSAPDAGRSSYAHHKSGGDFSLE
jgi:hypothetical protein